MRRQSCRISLHVTDANFEARGREARRSRDRRFLGDVVRPVPHDRADSRSTRDRIRRQGQGDQARHRRQHPDERALQRALDPDAAVLQGRRASSIRSSAPSVANSSRRSCSSTRRRKAAARAQCRRPPPSIFHTAASFWRERGSPTSTFATSSPTPSAIAARGSRATSPFRCSTSWSLFYLLSGEVANATLRGHARLARDPDRRRAGESPARAGVRRVLLPRSGARRAGLHVRVAHGRRPSPGPPGMNASDATVLFPYLASTTFDGFVEIVANEHVNYLVLQNGAVARTFLSSAPHGTVVERVAKLFRREGRGRRSPRHALGRRRRRFRCRRRPRWSRRIAISSARSCSVSSSADASEAPAIAEQRPRDALADASGARRILVGGRPAQGRRRRRRALTGGGRRLDPRADVERAGDHDVRRPKRSSAS